MHSTFQRLLATTALVGGLALASPVYAATTDGTDAGSSMTATTSHHHHMHKKWAPEDVETRIKTLHDKLGITADQEDDFKTLAQTMRDNDSNLKSLADERQKSGETRTAVEDLESWQKVTQAHADAASKLVDAFKPLYDSLSDDQKKNADEIFGKFEGHRGNPEASKPAAKTSK